MSRFSDTQLVILSSASRRNDRGVDLPANVTHEAVRKAVEKLIRAGLVEEVSANGSLLAWRRDVEAGPMALRITEQGLEAIAVEDAAVAAPEEIPISAAAAPKIETSAAEAIASRKRIAVAAQKPRKKPQPQGEEQSRLPARSPAGLEASARARDAGPSGRSDDCSHHARHPLAAALGPRLLRWCGAQEARPQSALGESRR
jgi:hypothetical protein